VFYESYKLDTRNSLNTNRICECILLNVALESADRILPLAKRRRHLRVMLEGAFGEEIGEE